MNVKLVGVLLVGVLIGTIIAFLIRQPEAQAQAQKEAQRIIIMRPCEYKVVVFADRENTEKELNKLGDAGWEYVGLINTMGGGPGGTHPMVAFKRPKS
jgi:hypothetical protein